MTRHVDIKLSYACNNNCVHCVVADQRGGALARSGRDFRTTEEVLREVEDAAARGFEVVTFTGGEPTIRRDLPRLVRRAVALGLGVGLQTNGRVLSHAPARESLCGLGVRFVVAVHGPDAATHDAVTRAPGSFGQTIDAVHALVARGEKVTGKIVMSRVNMASLPDIASLLVGGGVRRVNFTFPHGLGNAGRDFEGVVPRFAEVMPALLGAIAVVRDTGGEAVTEAVPLCLLGDLWSEVASEGLYRRLVRSEVRQLDQGPRDWSRDRVEGKAKAAACPRCPLDDRCEGVWREYLDAYGDEELRPPAGDRR